MHIPYHIRQAQKEDLPELAILFDLYRIFYKKPTDINGALAFLTERMERNESIIFLAEDQNEKIVGFTQLYPLFSSTRMKRLWVLNDLFVLESHRNLGISKSLIDRTKSLCIESQACGIILETSKDNDIGTNLYPSCGFKIDLVQNFYAWDNL